MTRPAPVTGSSPQPVVHRASEASGRVAIGAGPAFEVHEWTGGGPGYMHVHHADDETWHVISGVLNFRFESGEIEAGPGATVHVPAGVVHDYGELSTSRYLMILTPRLRKLIDALHAAPYEEHPAIMRRYESEIVE